MTLFIPDAQYNWGFLLWPAAILLLIVAVAIVLHHVSAKVEPGLYRTGEYGPWFNAAMWVSVGGGALGIVLISTIPTFAGYTDRDNRQDDLKVAALNEAGFEYVDLYDDEFVASRDGDYFKGHLLRLGDTNEYVVEETVPAE